MVLGDSWKTNQIGGDNQRGRGEGEEVCGGSEGGKGGTGDDTGVIEREINFISTFFDF